MAIAERPEVFSPGPAIGQWPQVLLIEVFCLIFYVISCLGFLFGFLVFVFVFLFFFSFSYIDGLSSFSYNLLLQFAISYGVLLYLLLQAYTKHGVNIH